MSYLSVHAADQLTDSCSTPQSTFPHNRGVLATQVKRQLSVLVSTSYLVEVGSTIRCLQP